VFESEVSERIEVVTELMVQPIVPTVNRQNDLDILERRHAKRARESTQRGVPAKRLAKSLGEQAEKLRSIGRRVDQGKSPSRTSGRRDRLTQDGRLAQARLGTEDHLSLDLLDRMHQAVQCFIV
jgi:hypothetical protein